MNEIKLMMKDLQLWRLQRALDKAEAKLEKKEVKMKRKSQPMIGSGVYLNMGLFNKNYVGKRRLPGKVFILLLLFGFGFLWYLRSERPMKRSK